MLAFAGAMPLIVPPATKTVDNVSIDPTPTAD